ncbi:MAG: hypothetical protein Q4C64_03910, partial [Erysipelotrichia bacterium]|nr:hypothetical protein [Erysipelotrichia bacterium]
MKRKTVYEFAKKYFEIFTQCEKIEKDDLVDFIDDCKRNNFQLSEEKIFFTEYGQRAYYDPDILKIIIYCIYDIDLLLSAIYNRWNYITWWQGYESLLSDSNREWFITAFSRLIDLSKESEEIIKLEIECCDNGKKETLLLDKEKKVLSYQQTLSATEFTECTYHLDSVKELFEQIDLNDFYNSYERYDIDNQKRNKFRITLVDGSIKEFENVFFAKTNKLIDFIGKFILNKAVGNMFPGLNKKEYIVCNVQFFNSQKTYAYLADEDIYKADDLVVVHVRNSYEDVIAKVESVQYLYEYQLPFSKNKMKYIIGKYEEEQLNAESD